MHEGIRRPRLIGVLDAQNETAALFARSQKAQQRGTSVAQMQKSCGTWRESCDQRR
jgi:hypothetical protein